MVLAAALQDLRPVAELGQKQLVGIKVMDDCVKEIVRTTCHQKAPDNLSQAQDLLKMKPDLNPASEAFMKEFQTRILGLLFT